MSEIVYVAAAEAPVFVTATAEGFELLADNPWEDATVPKPERLLPNALT